MNKLQKDHKKDAKRSRKRAYLKDLTVRQKIHVKKLVRRASNNVTMSAEKLNDTSANRLDLVPESSGSDTGKEGPAEVNPERVAEPSQ